MGRSSVEKVLLEDFQLKKHDVSFIGDWYNEIQKGVSDFRENCFKRFSGVNWSVIIIRGWSVYGDMKRVLVGS